jgi:hypothetical protein
LVAVEAVLAIVIVGAAATLTSLPPGVQPVEAAASPPALEPAARPPVTFAANAGAAFIQLSLEPGDIGSNHVHASITTGEASARDLPVRFRVEPPGDSGISPSTVTPKKEGNSYAATVDFSSAGRWTITVAGPGDAEAAFDFPVPLRGVGELLALSDVAARKLRSFVEETSETTSAGTSISRTEYVAPDRAHRRSGDEEDIRVGSMQYMHHGTMWHSQPSEPLKWPPSIAPSDAHDALLLGTEMLDGHECLVVQFVDSQSNEYHRLWIEAGDWRPLQLTTVAPGRTLTAKYSHFDANMKIVAPQ